MKELTFIRHCESLSNSLNDSEILNSPLSLKGINDAEKLCGKYDLIIVSPLRRCQETYKYSKLYAPHIITNELFREHITTITECLENEEFKIESVENLLKRIQIAKEYLNKLDEENICIITHADFVFYFTHKIIDNEYYGIWLDNGNKHIITLM